MVNTLVNFFVFGKKLWEIMENSFSSRFRLVFRLIWPPYQADMAPYQANTHRYQAVSWRRETTLILTMQSYENFKSKTRLFRFYFRFI